MAVDVVACGLGGLASELGGGAGFLDAAARVACGVIAGVAGDALGDGQVPFGFGEAGARGGADDAAPGADDVPGAGDLGAGVVKRVVEGVHGAGEGVRRVAGFFEFFVEFGVGIGQRGPRSERVGGALRFCDAQGAAPGFDGLGQAIAVDVGGVGCGEEVGGFVDFAADFGDQRLQSGDGLGDVVVGVLDAFDELLGLVQREVGGAQRVDEAALFAGGLGQ